MGFGRRLAAVSGATVIYVGAAATAYSFVKPTSDAGPDCSVSFDGLADRYDGLVNREETFMGVKLIRWWLVRQAKVIVTAHTYLAPYTVNHSLLGQIV